jgi:hypothetical protein
MILFVKGLLAITVADMQQLSIIFILLQLCTSFLLNKKIVDIAFVDRLYQVPLVMVQCIFLMHPFMVHSHCCRFALYLVAIAA